MPTCDRPVLLRRNLQSILDQIEPGIEIIVSDDSNNEESEKIVRELSEAYQCKITYRKNSGNAAIPYENRQAHNVNRLIGMSSGKFIYILHDDDYLIQGSLAPVLKLLNEHLNKQNVFLFGIYLVDLSGRRRRTQSVRKPVVFSSKSIVKELLSDSSFIRTPAIIVKKSVYEHVGLYNPERKVPLDLDMWTRIFPLYQVYYSNLMIANYTDHVNNLTMNNFHEQSLKIILNIFKDLRKTNILSEDKFRKYESMYIYQWILAGIFKNIRNGRLTNALTVYDLFALPEIREIPPPIKWLPLKIVFGFWIWLLRPFAKHVALSIN